MSNFWQQLPRPILALAPMAGVTDQAFRQICKEFQADVVYTEMVSAHALNYDNARTLRLMQFADQERPIVCQLFGNEPRMFIKAARLVRQAGFDGIDLNFGCPAKKIAGAGGGVILMRDLPKCREIIERTLAGAANLPVSIKLRRKINKTNSDHGVVTALDFYHAVQDLPLAAIMLHARSYEKPFSEDIDFAMIRELTRQATGPVLGNGGITTPEKAKEMMERTGCAGVGIARGAQGRPWLFQQIKTFLTTGAYHEFSLAQKKQLILHHAQLALATKNEKALYEMRKHLCWYVKGLPAATELRQTFMHTTSLKEIKTILKKI